MNDYSSPRTLDELARLESVPDRGESPVELRTPRSFLSLAADADTPSGAAGVEEANVRAVDLQAVRATQDDAIAGWEVYSPVRLTQGLNVVRAEEAELPAADADLPDQLDPHVPDWSGVDYSPRIAPELSPHTAQAMRRRDGTRVRPEIVFGPENRTVYYPSGYPWRCIGRIFVWASSSNANWSWSGSAVLISKNSILTCSHMAPWASVSAGTAWKALFVPGYWDGVSVNGAGSSAWVTGLWGYKNHAQGDDMAVMALNAPLGASLGWFGAKTYSTSWEDNPVWTLCGYPGAIAGAQRPSGQVGFPIQDDDNDGAGVELEYEADASDGNSGGPVFGWWDNPAVPYVIGTHSGSEEEAFDTNNVAAGGAALVNLVKWARDNWGG